MGSAIDWGFWIVVAGCLFGAYKRAKSQREFKAICVTCVFGISCLAFIGYIVYDRLR
jgi:hypothetical protein